MPSWVEKLEFLEFGDLWGPVDEFEMLWHKDEHAFARWRVLPREGEAELLRIAVAQAHRRTGLAKSLMRECINYLVATGVESAHLEVRDSNIPAKALYKSLGWQQINVRKAYYKDGEDAAVYRLALQSQGIINSEQPTS
jgi:ribosomal-protein-alanine N-acetyltransferase